MDITLKNKCCLNVIISIRFFSITTSNLLIDFLSYLFRISNSGLRYEQPKDPGGGVWLKSPHLSKYVNRTANTHLATCVVQDSAQKRVLTADQRRARNRHLINTFAIHLCTRKRKSENKRLGAALSLIIRITVLFLHMT